MKKLKIRLIKKTEIIKVAELTNEAYLVPYKPGKMTTRANETPSNVVVEIEQGTKIFVAEIEDQIVGAVQYKLSGNIAVLSRLVVDCAYRNKGIGGRLLNYIFQYSKAEGINSLSIEVAENKGLIPYYESFGFAITKRYLHKEHYEVLMIKNLLKTLE